LDLEAYQPDAAPDEAVLPGGALRTHWRALAATLRQWDGDTARLLQERTARASADFAVGTAPVLDPLPLLLSEGDWRVLEAGFQQRVTALNRFLDDIYGAARIVRDGVVPAAVLRSSPQFRVELRGVDRPHGVSAAVCAIDVVRTPEGFRVVRDNLRCPAGGARMVAHRRVLEATLRSTYEASGPLDVTAYARALLETLSELAPGNIAEPRVALLTPGPYNAGFDEHAFLADAAGMELVEGGDLLVDDGCVHMRIPRGPRRVHVVYRQVDDDFLDPLTFRPDSVLGVPGLVHACRQGHVGVANAPGSGVADDPGVFPFIPDAIQYYLGEEPLLPGVETWTCRRPDHLEYTLDHLPELVVEHRRDGAVVFGPELSTAEHDAWAARLRADPSDFVARQIPAMSRAPCLVDGRLRPGAVTLRCFVLQGRSARVVPGALCRVLPPGAAHGSRGIEEPGSKDVWVVPDAPSA